MNDVLVRNWNSRVAKNDMVIHLGDFAFKEATEARKWLSLLNGHITLLKGNHDCNNSINTRILSLIVEIAHNHVYCNHFPRYFNNDYEINLVGHVHDLWKIRKVGRSYLVNVGVDVWDFAPVSINEILNALKDFKKGYQGIKKLVGD